MNSHTWDKGFYDRAAWRKLRKVILARDAVCTICRVAASTQVDHIVPRQEDQSRELDPDNLRGCCHQCHSRITMGGVQQRQEGVGREIKCRGQMKGAL